MTRSIRPTHPAAAATTGETRLSTPAAVAAPLLVPVLLGMLLVAGFATLAAAATAPSQPAEPGGSQERGVIARVNGEAIYLQDIEGRLREMHREVSQTHRTAPDLDLLMYRLVNDTLLAQEGRALGLDQEAPIPSEVEKLSHDLAVQHLQRVEIQARVDITEDEIRKSFEREYRQVTLRVVTTYEREAAEKALADIRAGADFAEVAKERSVDPYQLRGGLVEALPKVDLMTEIADAAFDAEPGDLIGPIQTPIGWAVIRVEELQPAPPARLDEVRGDVREMIHYREARRLKQELAERLRATHPVELVDAVLSGIVPERIEDGRLIPLVANGDAVVARVGGSAILASEYGEALTWRWKGVRSEAAARAAAKLVLDGLIEERLLLVEALARGYDRIPEVARVVQAHERQLVVKSYLQEVLGATIEVSHDEMQAYYREHQDRFRRPPRYHLSQITVEKREEADRIAGLLREGSDLGWLARQHSIDGYRDKGGERGWVSPMPGADSLSDQLLASDVGDVLGPVGAPGKWIVIQVDAQEEQGPYPFDKVSGNVRSEVFQRKFQVRVDEVLNKLRSRSEIEIYEQALAALRITGTREEAADAGHGN